MSTTPGREAAAEATFLFLDRDYDACTQTLENLVQQGLLDEPIEAFKVQNASPSMYGIRHVIARMANTRSGSTQLGGGRTLRQCKRGADDYDP